MKEISLTQEKVALVDDEDYERLSKYSWQYEKRKGMARRLARFPEVLVPTAIAMACEILQTRKLVDHKDRNPLNNQKSNLRLCTDAQNQQNKKKSEGTSSKYKGVYFRKYNKKWQAYIGFQDIFGGKGRTQLGTFSIEEDAARAYDKAARQSFGEFACLNFPEERERSCLCP